MNTKLIRYEYIHGDGLIHEALRSDDDAQEFIGNSSSHGRRIIEVLDAAEAAA